jgi:hypothetical protein
MKLKIKKEEKYALCIKLKKIIEFNRAHKPSSECKKETNLGMILGVIGIQLKSN